VISFIWPSGAPMLAGTGGSETYTAGQVRELLRRGIKAQVVTIGHGLEDGRRDFPDIPFLALPDEQVISKLPGTVIFVNEARRVPTKHRAFVIFHCPAPVHDTVQQARVKEDVKGKNVLVTSVSSGQQWALYLDIPSSQISVVLPFADPVFSKIKRPKFAGKTRILYAGRLHPHKGIYTVLEMMHYGEMQHNGFVTSIVLAGLHAATGREIARMLKNYPYAKLVAAVKTVSGMAKLLTRNDILLMPSSFGETFGMLSVEAQHAGCRVVASNIGGIPETNCGLLTLVEPRNSLALLQGIQQAVALGPATKKERKLAGEKFSLSESVTMLLEALR
jgi:glycosyltransferase involved in cell wall biosynthesis